MTAKKFRAFPLEKVFLQRATFLCPTDRRWNGTLGRLGLGLKGLAQSFPIHAAILAAIHHPSIQAPWQSSRHPGILSSRARQTCRHASPSHHLYSCRTHALQRSGTIARALPGSFPLSRCVITPPPSSHRRAIRSNNRSLFCFDSAAAIRELHGRSPAHWYSDVFLHSRADTDRI